LPAIASLDQIKRALDINTLIGDIERGFVAYSRGETVVPPVGYLAFDAPNAGDVHIKYGYIRGEEFWVVKIASGFPGNAGRGIPANNGLMLLFRQDTGELATILLDEGHLTDVRTAVAGAIAAKFLASKVERIGVLGTGVQARLQVQMLSLVSPCRDVVVWGRATDRVALYERDMTALGYYVRVAASTRDVAAACNLIVTTTAARTSLLASADVRPGTHITAMGADAPGKQELDPALVARADVLVADSRSQCLDHGELAHSARAKLIDPARVRELGEFISDRSLGRRSSDQITIADLTGVAVQDIQIATHVHRRLQY
jgi:ornithine cyclodeaminase